MLFVLLASAVFGRSCTSGRDCHFGEICVDGRDSENYCLKMHGRGIDALARLLQEARSYSFDDLHFFTAQKDDSCENTDAGFTRISSSSASSVMTTTCKQAYEGIDD